MTLQYAVCDTCRLKHLAKPGSDEAKEFFAWHRGRGHVVRLVEPDSVLARLRALLGVDLFRKTLSRGRERTFEVDRLGYLGYAGNANVKTSYASPVAMTITSANLTTSATAGWQSAAIDNTSNLYLDYLFHVALAAVNTAPATPFAVYLFAFGLVDPAGSVYTSTGDATPGGTVGTLLFPNVTTLPVVAPLLGTIPYSVQNRAINGGPFSHAAAFGLQSLSPPPKLAIGMVNQSGMTLNVTSITYTGVYLTVS